MDYEKKYKSLFEAVRTLKEANPSDEGIQNWVKDNVPELQESEDERIRKDLIGFFKDDAFLCHKNEQIIAWLEKQGEQKPFDYENANIQQNDFAPNVEPKFKVGDWITTEDKDVHEDYRICRICKVDNDKYYIENGDFFNKGTLNAYEYHLWTIQDAKDGDVLDANGAPFIYKKHDKDYVYFYCGINLAGEFIEANGIDTWNNNNKVYPATKEQRDLLFQKMKEAGYEWDAEKKELKKIEQKPSWSEEDEDKLNSCINAINAVYKWDVMINWLKSLKDRVQPHNRWKPSGEQMEALKSSTYCQNKQMSKVLFELYQDLKKLRED